MEQIDSFDALGRNAGADLVSSVAVPPLDNSTMDGYAVRVADLSDPGAVLPMSGALRRGRWARRSSLVAVLASSPVRQCLRALMPWSCRTHRAAGAGQVRFNEPVRPGQNIRRAGGDIQSGQAVLSAGVRLTPAALGVAASVGAAQVPVYRRARVAVLTTNNELVMPGQPLPAGAIYNSNRHTLRGLVQTCGAQAADLGVIPRQSGADPRGPGKPLKAMT